MQILGFEQIEAPDLGFKVIWLSLPSTGFAMHFIERLPEARLPEGPYSATSPTADPKFLPRGHHLCFSVSNFDSFVQTLKVRKATPFRCSFSSSDSDWWGYSCRWVVVGFWSCGFCICFGVIQQRSSSANLSFQSRNSDSLYVIWFLCAGNFAMGPVVEVRMFIKWIILKLCDGRSLAPLYWMELLI